MAYWDKSTRKQWWNRDADEKVPQDRRPYCANNLYLYILVKLGISKPIECPIAVRLTNSSYGAWFVYGNSLRCAICDGSVMDCPLSSRRTNSNVR